jgi:hypothetical protein
MKKFVSLVLLATSLAVSARAAVIVGADVGYLVDGEEVYYSARVGLPVAASNTLTHQVELELGYTSQEDSGAEGDFVPLTVNYRFESTPASKLGYYFGAGAGIAFTDVSGFGVSDDGSSFAAQAFAGLTYQANPTVSLHAGVKYIWIDDVELFGTDVEVGDDLVVSAGISFKF